MSVLTAKPAEAATVSESGGTDCTNTVDNATDVVVTKVGTDCVVQFKRVGTTNWTVPTGVSAVRYLVVGGGGGGGIPGAGGAGAFRNGSKTVTPGTSYRMIVGVGGAAGKTDTNGVSGISGTNGGDSSAFEGTALEVKIIGGGGGGSLDDNAYNGGKNGASGGSGTWGSYNKSTNKATAGGSGLDGYSAGYSDDNGPFVAGGGGGAGGVGQNATTTKAGDGGLGKYEDITGVNVGYAGGGGGSWFQTSTITAGTASSEFGGGNGASSNYGTSAVSNKGGGGGGGRPGYMGGAGGSGVVIVRYAISSVAPIISSQPSSTTVTSGNTATFSVTATSTSGTLSYQWENSTDGTNWTTVSGATASSYTTGNIAFSDNGKKFRVKVTNTESGKSPLIQTSNVATLTVRTAPSQVTGLTATAGDKQVALSWSAPSNGGSAITDYEYTTNNGTNWKSTGKTSSPITITQLSDSITTLANGTTYTIQLRAVNTVGSGDASEAVQATPFTEDTAFRFNGDKQYGVANTKVIPASGAFTVAAWIKPASDIQNYARFISQGPTSGNHFRLERNNLGEVYWRYGAYSSTFGQLPLDTWTHVALTFSPTTGTATTGIRGYINGTQVYSCSNCTITYDVGTKFIVGSDASAPDASPHPWKGSIDEVRVYHAVGDSTQIKNDMHNYATVSDSNLAAYFDFNQGTGTEVVNKSTGLKKVSDSDLTIISNGTNKQVTWEKIVTEYQDPTTKKNFRKFNRTYLTSDGGWNLPLGVEKFEVMAVGAGGGGASRHAGGGGGGNSNSQQIVASAGSKFTVVVGAGGPGGNGGNGYVSNPGTKGGDSKVSGFGFTDVTATGGSGGVATKGGTSGSGISGGNGSSSGSWGYAGGGGGGAGSIGGNAVSSSTGQAGLGGTGKIISWFTPTLQAALGGGQVVSGKVYFGGGGSGGNTLARVRSGGIGGGGNGGSSSPQDGTGNCIGWGAWATSGLANSGGGGGGSGCANDWTRVAGSGGSGLVVLSYFNTGTPAQVTGLTATGGLKQVELSWSTPSDGGSAITDYVIEISSDNETWSTVEDGVSTGTNFRVTNLDGDKTFYFRVTAVNVNGYGTESDVKSAVTFGTMKVNFEELNFAASKMVLTDSSSTIATAICTSTNVSSNCIGKNLNDRVFYKNVFSRDGVEVDAVVTTKTLSSTTIAKYEIGTGASGNDRYFETDMVIGTSGGYAEFQFDFYLAGTYVKSTNSGTKVTLENVSVTGFDIDYKQFTYLTNVNSYTVTNPTYIKTEPLTISTWPANIKFQGRDAAADNDPRDQVVTNYATIDSFIVRMGSNTASSTTKQFFGVSFKSLPWGTYTPVTYGPTSAKVTLTYQDNGKTSGTVPTSRTEFVGTNITISGNTGTLVKSGHTFGGWNTAADGSGTSYAVGSNLQMPNGGATLFAQWIPNVYSVSYNANGGSGAPSSITAPANSEVELAFQTPIKSGFTFIGWNTSADGTGTAYTDSTFVMPPNNLILYAKWQVDDFELSYNNNGGSAGDVQPVTLDSGVSTTLAAGTGFTKTGFWLAGWSTSPTATSAEYALSGPFVMPAEDTTLYAVWVSNEYDVSYLANGGSPTPPAQKKATDSTVLIGAAPTRIGYDFGGWQKDGTETVFTAGGTFTMPAGNVVLHAKWTAQSFALNYDNNGGTGAPSAGSFTTGTNATVSNTLPTRDGYTFTGWNTAQNGSGTSYTAGNTFKMPTSPLTIFAQWVANPYVLSYDSNGGLGLPSASSNLVGSTVTVAAGSSATAPTYVMLRDGYTFAGWNTLADGTGTNYVAETGTLTMPANNLTLYAKWTANTYTVVYNANEGSNAPATESKTTDSTVTVSSTLPIRAGYTFGGWNTVADGSGASYNASATFTMPARDVILYAKWTAINYKFTYYLQGGTSSPVLTTEPSQTVNTPVTISSTLPTKPGYTFNGWNTVTNGTGTGYLAGSTLIMPPNDVKLYAQWIGNNYIVSYNSNGGTGAPLAETKPAGTTVTAASTIPTRAGYTFGGWNTAANGTGTNYLAGTGTFSMPTNDVTLYAKWTVITYTLSYNNNGGSAGTVTSATVDSGASTPLNDGTGFEKSGYWLAGWATTASATSAEYVLGGSLVMPTNNVTLYAVWVSNEYDVSYLANGGSPTPPAQKKATDSTVLIGAAPTRIGYDFGGWQKDGTGTVFTAGGTFTMPAGNVVLHAKWTAQSFALNYDNNGGTGSPSAGSFTTGTNATVSNTLPTRDGYTFTGWNTAQNGSGVSYTAGNTFLMPANAITIYAQWLPKSYSVTYNGNGGVTSIAAKNYDTGSSVNIESAVPTRTGYNFLAWTAEADGSGTLRTSTNNSIFSIASTNIVFYAKWEAATYQLSYDKNTGTGTEPEPEIGLSYLSVIEEIARPSQINKSGFNFVGWNTAADGSGISYSPGFSMTMPGQNLVLYAQWVVNFQPQEDEESDNNGGGGNNNSGGNNNNGGNNGGNSSTDVTPTASPSPTATNTSRGPGNSGGNSGNNQGNASRPSPTATSANGSNGNAGGQNNPNRNSPFIFINPMMPGIGGLINSLVPIPGMPANPSMPATPDNGTSNAGANNGNANASNGMSIVAKTTVDLGSGVIELTEQNFDQVSQTSTQGQRSLNQFGEEKLGGFHPPGSGIRIEVLGARSGARFVLSDAAQVDAKALITALNNSIQTQAANFFTINEVKPVPTAPQKPKEWTPEQQEFMDQFFAGAGLPSPRSLADLNYNEIFNWVGVSAQADTYVPGSTVYLTVTSEPLVLASAVVDKYGKVQIQGSLPVEFLNAGEHRIRLVGTRSLDGVFVDDQGEVQVTPETLTEIERFDLSTQATIGLIGTNINGGSHVAMRVIPLIPTAPWWTIALLAMVGLGAIWMRRNDKLVTKQKQLIANGVIVAATLPAVILGWLSTVTSVVWVGIALSIVLNVLFRTTKVKQVGSHTRIN